MLACGCGRTVSSMLLPLLLQMLLLLLLLLWPFRKQHFCQRFGFY